MLSQENKSVKVVYTNYKGETSVRNILPIRIVFESSSWHPEPQWVLVAYDTDKEAERSFAMRDIHQWDCSEVSHAIDKR